MVSARLIRLIGATGYIGGRLAKELEAQGCRVRCPARQPEFLRARGAGDVSHSPDADSLVGGVGVRRGRRDARQLLLSDVVDCWRVETIEPPRHLWLAAERKLPGWAWLDFGVPPAKDGVTLRQTVASDPVGLSDLFHWYVIFPLHELVFRGMIRGLGRAAVAVATENKPDAPPTPESPPNTNPKSAPPRTH